MNGLLALMPTLTTLVPGEKVGRSQPCGDETAVGWLKICTAAPLLVMVTFCAAAVPPTCTLKFTGFGLATNPAVPPPIVSVTGTTTCARPEASVRFPV